MQHIILSWATNTHIGVRGNNARDSVSERLRKTLIFSSTSGGSAVDYEGHGPLLRAFRMTATPAYKQPFNDNRQLIESGHEAPTDSCDVGNKDIRDTVGFLTFISYCLSKYFYTVLIQPTGCMSYINKFWFDLIRSNNMTNSSASKCRSFTPEKLPLLLDLRPIYIAVNRFALFLPFIVSNYFTARRFPALKLISWWFWHCATHCNSTTVTLVQT